MLPELDLVQEPKKETTNKKPQQYTPKAMSLYGGLGIGLDGDKATAPKTSIAADDTVEKQNPKVSKWAVRPFAYVLSLLACSDPR